MSEQLASDRIGATDSPAYAAVRIATGVGSANQCIARIGARSGAFAKQGLNVTFPRLEVGGPESVAGLLRGDWDFAQTGTVPVAEAVLKGGDAVILLRDSIGHDNTVILTTPAMTALRQLDGKKVGVPFDAYSGQTGVIARLAVERAGATATYVGLGTFRNIFAALLAGDIDAGALPIDYHFLEESRQRWNCFTPHSLNVPSVLATTRRVIAADRQRVLRFLRGFIEAIHAFKTETCNVVPALQEFLVFSDLHAGGRVRDHYASMLPIVPRPTLTDGMQGLRDLFSQKYPAARGLTEQQLVDASLIDQLEQSGFIAELYGQSSDDGSGD
jgi:ABC-type nitrate/sulfonate/bicarbonate transport system substrate-binding protein